ncbi:uncharacterized protein LOC143428641 [Xylocopa sonorina]|uniref:uncharacterized protein LOC143428641 n=1 Tax=Xylocopa sonorina TaxID=1818115 RepID=UPI00403B1373
MCQYANPMRSYTVYTFPASDKTSLLDQVTFACFASGILTAGTPWDTKSARILEVPSRSYLPAANTALPKLPQRAVFVTKALDSGWKDVGVPAGNLTVGRRVEPEYSYLKPLLIDLELPVRDQPIKSINEKQRSTAERHEFRATSTASPVESFRTNGKSGLEAIPTVEYHPHGPERSSYQVVEEEDDNYSTDDSHRSGARHRGKARATNPYRNSQDVTTAIKALDRFLSGALNDDGYNSELHPPPNPVLALLLSRYGRYVPGTRHPRVYAHMAVNNIHNNKPFGSYKLECEELPTYAR